MGSTGDGQSGSETGAATAAAQTPAGQMPEAEAPGSGPTGGTGDLLTIALLVFFVSLLLIVAAMLALPAIVR
jgi:hypothetical protein